MAVLLAAVVMQAVPDMGTGPAATLEARPPASQLSPAPQVTPSHGSMHAPSTHTRPSSQTTRSQASTAQDGMHWLAPSLRSGTQIASLPQSASMLHEQVHRLP